MTRFGVFGGGPVPRRSGLPTIPPPPGPRARAAVSWPPPAPTNDPAARHRAAGTTPLRSTLTAAAIVGGALAVALPTAFIWTPGGPTDPPTDPAKPLRLAADQQVPQPGGPAVLPAVEHTAALPPELEVAGLVKAAGMAARGADPARPAGRRVATGCEAEVNRLGPVKPWTRSAARFLACLYDERGVAGVTRTAGSSELPSELTVDFPVSGKHSGDRIASCALANREELGVESVLWRQRANDGDGWERMPDRGGDTANHRDHVRISFARQAPDGDPLAGRCR